MAFALKAVSRSTEVNDSLHPPSSLTLRLSGSSLQTRTKALSRSQGHKSEKLWPSRGGGVGVWARQPAYRAGGGQCPCSRGPWSTPCSSGIGQSGTASSPSRAHILSERKVRSCSYLTSERTSFVPHQDFGEDTRDQSQKWGAPQGPGSWSAGTKALLAIVVVALTVRAPVTFLSTCLSICFHTDSHYPIVTSYAPSTPRSTCA